MYIYYIGTITFYNLVVLKPTHKQTEFLNMKNNY